MPVLYCNIYLSSIFYPYRTVLFIFVLCPILRMSLSVTFAEPKRMSLNVCILWALIQPIVPPIIHKYVCLYQLIYFQLCVYVSSYLCMYACTRISLSHTHTLMCACVNTAQFSIWLQISDYWNVTHVEFQWVTSICATCLLKTSTLEMILLVNTAQPAWYCSMTWPRWNHETHVV